MSSPWIRIPRPNPGARVRLFTFPHAGAGATIFRTWHEFLPPTIEVCAVQLPGREDRIHEKPYEQLEPLLSALAEVIRPEMDRPSAFFGHSFGAVLAFELATRLPVERAPKLLLVSGRPAPQVPLRFSPIHQLSRAEFLDAVVQRYQAIPAAVLREPELLELVLPALQADMGMAERHRGLSLTPVPVSLVAFGGSRDTLVNADELGAWRALTTCEFEVETFDGDHFYLSDPVQKPKLLTAIARRMALLG